MDLELRLYIWTDICINCQKRELQISVILTNCYFVCYSSTSRSQTGTKALMYEAHHKYTTGDKPFPDEFLS